MYQIIRLFLFLFPAETAHHLSFRSLKIINNIPLLRELFIYRNKKAAPVNVMGLTFRNRLGLAAGFDKNGVLIDELANFGFGFVEVGTVTPKPQPGNPGPRIFRLKKDEALINRMGFNNQGVDALIERLKKVKNKDIIIGGNIGKNKVTPNEKALEDYLTCFKKLFDYVDYFVVNVSSPNTPNLRELQDKEPLTALLQALCSENAKKPKPKPILLKIAPDLNEAQVDDICDIINSVPVKGIVINNTTISREGLKSSPKLVKETGGLSGKPLTNRSNTLLATIKSKLHPDKTVIGVGGIMNADHAQERIKSGADLVQIYTGFVYNGPPLVKRIIEKLNPN